MQNSEKSSHTKALYSQILNEFRERIISGDLAVGARLPTELEIAQKHHISRGTVRQALSVLVNEGLLERIQGSGTFVRQPPSLVQLYQEQEPLHAPQFQKSIGLILSQVGDELNLDILLGAERAAKPRGYQLSFAYAEENNSELALDIARLRATTAGLIIFPTSDTPRDTAIMQLKAENFPFVLVDRYIPELDCDYVTSDNIGGGYRATEHLLILGHTRIGFAYSSAGGLFTTSVRDRWEGYRKALHEYQRPYDESLVYGHLSGYDSDVSNVYDDIILREDRPSAIFAVNDAVALGFFRAAQRHNLRVPEDLALIGFDDLTYAAHLSTPLTTVAQQRIELGIHAGNLLINRIESPVVTASKHVELSTNLIIRQSCGARLRVSSAASGDQGIPSIHL